MSQWNQSRQCRLFQGGRPGTVIDVDRPPRIMFTAGGVNGCDPTEVGVLGDLVPALLGASAERDKDSFHVGAAS